MDFTQDFWIGGVLGLFVGFLICWVLGPTTIKRDTGPHIAPPPPPDQ
jgi:hypothetical protein